MTTTINWITYDGTPETRPHSIKEFLYDKGWNLIPELRAVYLLRPHGEEKVNDQGYTLQPVEASDESDTPVFVGWEWESRWPDFGENNITYPLTVGDMWAEWPTVPKKGAEPCPAE